MPVTADGFRQIFFQKALAWYRVGCADAHAQVRETEKVPLRLCFLFLIQRLSICGANPSFNYSTGPKTPHIAVASDHGVL